MSGSAFDPAVEVAKYAAAIERSLEGLQVRLLLEPGRFLIAQAGALLARVLVSSWTLRVVVPSPWTVTD